MDENRAAERRMHRLNLFFPLVLILAVTVYSLLSGGGSSVITQIDSGILGIANVTETTYIELVDVESAELVTELDAGTAETDDVNCIHYTNEVFGDYLLYRFEDTTNYVVIRTAEQTVVVNAKNEKATEKFYAELTAALNAL